MHLMNVIKRWTKCKDYSSGCYLFFSDIKWDTVICKKKKNYKFSPIKVVNIIPCVTQFCTKSFIEVFHYTSSKFHYFVDSETISESCVCNL